MARLKFFLKSIVFLGLIFLFSCNQKQDSNIASSDFSSPLLITEDTTLIHLDDFFLGIDSINKIEVYNGYLFFRKGKSDIQLISPKVAPTLSKVVLYTGKNEYVLILKAIASEKVTIAYDPQDKKLERVFVAGSFNGWNTTLTPLQNKGEIWETKIRLPYGKYEYKFVVDGKWMSDPANNDSVANNLGGYNSVFQVGLEKGEKPVLETEFFDKMNIYFSSSNVKNVIALWQNTELQITSSADGDMVQVPEQARSLSRSFVRIYGANKNSFSNDILIPLDHGKVIENPKLLKRTDKHSLQLYNVFIDRFFDGDSTNNRPLNVPEVHPRADYHGGDIAGIDMKIKQGYFEDLGINTLWLSPIVQNPDSAYGFYPDPPTKFSAYHGYWPISFTKIDNRFGNDSIFSTLIEHAHSEDLNILVDFVANHVHQLHPVYQKHPEWATNLYLPDGSLNTERWDDHRFTTWFDTFLPTLDHTIPEVTELISDSALSWLNKYDIDGFRHDATKHVPDIFWRTLTRKIKQEKKPGKMFYQIGETYATPQLIGSYVNSGQMDGQFDFNVYDAEVNVFASRAYNFSHLSAVIEESLRYYGSHHLMGNISGNQDRARFVSYADGSIAFEEDSKYAGWNRDIKVRDTLALFKMAMLMAVNFTIPGLPVIYYGDEIGMAGGNDPDCRRMMKFSELNLIEEGLFNKVKTLSRLRRNSMALMYGDFQVIELTDFTFVYKRSYFNQSVIVAFNNHHEKNTMSVKIPTNHTSSRIKNHFDQKYHKTGDQIKIEMNPYSFEIISIN